MLTPPRHHGHTLKTNSLANYGGPECPSNAFDRAIPSDRAAYIFARPYLWPSPTPPCALCSHSQAPIPLPDFPAVPHRGLLSLHCTNPECRNHKGVHYGPWAAQHRHFLTDYLYVALHMPQTYTSLYYRLKLLYLSTLNPAPTAVFIKTALSMSYTPKSILSRMDLKFLTPLIEALHEHVEAKRDRGFRTSGL